MSTEEERMDESTRWTTQPYKLAIAVRDPVVKYLEITKDTMVQELVTFATAFGSGDEIWAGDEGLFFHHKYGDDCIIEVGDVLVQCAVTKSVLLMTKDLFDRTYVRLDKVRHDQ